MTRPPENPGTSEDEDDGVPASFGARLVLTATPFLMAGVVWLLLRWWTG